MLMIMIRLIGNMAGRVVSILPYRFCEQVVRKVVDKYPQTALEAIGPKLNRSPSLDTMPFDIPLGSKLEFEDLAGLFASTSLDHGVVAMPVRQVAYLYGIVKRMRSAKVIEIGRYKGGSTTAIAAALPSDGKLWSIDIGEKEERLHPGIKRSFDDQLRDICRKFDLNVEIIVGNSRTIEVETGDVDLVFIDGEHSYEGAKNDFERFGRRVRIGGSVMFDDAFDEKIFKTHSDEIGRLVYEIVDEGKFRLVKAVNRLAHLERIEAD